MSTSSKDMGTSGISRALVRFLYARHKHERPEWAPFSAHAKADLIRRNEGDLSPIPALLPTVVKNLNRLSTFRWTSPAKEAGMGGVMRAAPG